MTTQTRAPGMSWVVPYLIVKDAAKAAAFYRDVFGFTVLNQHTDDKGEVKHAELQYQDIVIMCGSEGQCGPIVVKSPASGGFVSPVTLYVYCEQVDALYNQLKQKGLKITQELQDAFWGDRMFAVEDPDGHAWCFATFTGQLSEKPC